MGGTAVDHRGSRRLAVDEEWAWYLIAGVSYITFSLWHKWLLNWFIGPAWLVTTVVIGPWLFDRVTGRSRSRSESPP